MTMRTRTHFLEDALLSLLLEEVEDCTDDVDILR